MLSDQQHHFSGILVVARPGALDACIRALEDRAGVTVATRDPERDRVIVVLDAPSRQDLESLHRSLLALPGVVTADPIVHYVEED